MARTVEIDMEATLARGRMRTVFALLFALLFVVVLEGGRRTVLAGSRSRLLRALEEGRMAVVVFKLRSEGRVGRGFGIEREGSVRLRSNPSWLWVWAVVVRLKVREREAGVGEGSYS